jgi:hypothetical protein
MHTDTWHEETTSSRRRRRFGRGVATAASGALLLAMAGLLAPGSARADDAPPAPASPVDQPPSLAGTILPVATAAGPFSYQLPVVGYPPPTVTLSSADSLPAGLTLDPDGLLHGTPTQAGSYFFDVELANSVATADYTLGLDVDPSQIHITTAALPVGVAGQGYQASFTADGIPAAESWVSPSALPNGLFLDPDLGVVYGTLDVPAGDYPFTILASNGTFDLRTFVLHVIDAPVTIAGSPPDGTVGQPYSFAFTLGGTPAPTVRVAAGTLPPGQTLSPDGVLSGTPTVAESTSVGIVADNGAQQVVETVWLNVDPAPITPRLTVSDASGKEGDAGTRAMTFRVTLNASNGLSAAVHWTTANGTATAGSDYVRASGILYLPPGQTSATITVLVNGDRRKEPNETFHLRLSQPNGATIADGNALGRIVNDD